MNSAIAQNGSVTISYTIADANNRQLSSGNTYTVAASGSASSELVLSGDVNYTPTDDTVLTTRQVTVTDKGGSGGAFSLTFTSSGESGTLTKTITGTVTAPAAIVSGYASSIQLMSGSPSATTISVKGTGATETSTMSFVVKDSLGNPVSVTRAATIAFSIVGGPGGGETVSPPSAVTDANGDVAATINAGTKAGVVQVVATTTVNGKTITSSPVTVTIAGGLPNQNHLTVWTDKSNYPGLIGQGGTLGKVLVQVGDVYGNPVQPSAMYFSATGGGISPASITTDATGSGQVSILGGNPSPINGLDTITVATNGVGGASVSAKTVVVFSGSPVISSSEFPTDTIGTIAAGSSLSVRYKVEDANKNPLASGNTISLAVSGTAASYVTLSGNTSVTTADTKDTLTTRQHIAVVNNVPQGGTGGTFRLTITVTGPNGTATKKLIGTVTASTSSAPTQLALASVSNNIIAAKGSGGLNTSNLTFQALDSTGRSIDITRSDTVFFTVDPTSTSGGSYVIPTFALTNGSGQASTIFYGGSQFGNDTITARMKTFSTKQTIRISGPSFTNFNATMSTTNLPGLSKIGSVVGTVNIQLGDTLGNPVLSGTQVNFSTSGGMVDPSATTGTGGSATVNLYGGVAPKDPTIGWGNVTVQTQGNNGVTLQKKVPFLFSGTPVITTLDVPASDSVLVYTKSKVDVDYKIADINRNPLAAGNSVQVNITGAAAPYISLIGYSNFITTGTTDTNATVFRVTLQDAQAANETGGNFDVAISVSGPNGSASNLFHGYLQAPGTIGGSTTDSISSIVCTSTSTDISVQGTGKTETATLIFIGKDKSGKAVDLAHGSLVTFAISSPSLGATLTITSAQTDANGQATTLVRAGTISGAIQVVASAVVNGVTIKSLPVNISINSGLPDQGHFSIAAKFYNFPGLDFDGQTVPITVFMADKYSNPVSLGTTAYFYSTHGNIVTVGSVTNSTGEITQNLLSQNPRPDPLDINGTSGLPDTVSYGPQDKYMVNLNRGWTRVYAQTFNDAGGMVEDSIPVLWTGAPIITSTGITNGTVGYNSSIGGLSFTVKDRFGHPMSATTTISVTAGSLPITSDAPTIGMPDATAGGEGLTSFMLSLTGPGTAPTTPSTYNVVVTVVHPVYGTFSSTIATITVLTTP